MSATPQARAAPGSPSLARSVVIAGLLLQVALIIASDAIAGARYVEGLLRGETNDVLGVVFPLLLLALVYPVARGVRWAIAAATVLQLLLALADLPIAGHQFANPASLSEWVRLTGIFVVGLVAGAFGVVAFLENLGRAQPSRYLLPSGGLSREGAVLVGLGGLVTGMLALAVAVALSPQAGSTFPDPPADVLRLPISSGSHFGQDTIQAKAGQATAIFVTNNDTIGHSFDVDALGVHVSVPPGTTALAMVRPGAAGELEFYCSVPGHRQAGMVGRLDAR